MIEQYLLRKARKLYQCSEQSYHTIQQGQIYFYGAYPPWHEAIRGRAKKWQIIRACLRCAKEFNMLTHDMQKQLEEIK